MHGTRQQQIAVIGGGMTGCVFAAEVAKAAGFKVDIYEAGDRLGGLHHSPVINGSAYDIGAFFFQPDHQAFSTFPGLLDHFVSFPVRVRSISDHGKLDRYPLSISGYLRNNGITHFVAAVANLALSKIRHCKSGDLPGHIKYYIGSAIYERSGLRNYIERLFGIPDREVDVTFAIKRMENLRKWGSFRRCMVRFAAGPLRFLREPYTPPTALARPRNGFLEAYTFIENSLASLGVGVLKNTKIASISRSGGTCLIRDREGNERAYDRIVSTAPLPVTARLIGIQPTHSFETVALLTLFYRYSGKSGFDAAVLYNFSSSGPWKRITDFGYIYGGNGYMSAELPVSAAEPPDAEVLRAEFERHIGTLKLFPNGLSFEGSALTPNAYPIYRANGIEALAADKRRVTDWGIDLAGRQGEFEYASSAQVALSAAAKAREIISRAA